MNPTQKYSNITKLGVIPTPYGGSTEQEGNHPGIDIANKMGAPVPALKDGVIVGTDMGHAHGENNYGNSVILKDREGNVHRYSHLNDAMVKPGQQVSQGQEIGTFGNTGAAYSKSGQGDGTNLDVRIVNAYGKYKSPLTYLRNL